MSLTRSLLSISMRSGFGMIQPFSLNDDELYNLKTLEEWGGQAGIETVSNTIDGIDEEVIETEGNRGMGGLRGK